MLRELWLPLNWLLATCATTIWVAGIGLLWINRRRYRLLADVTDRGQPEGPLPPLSILVPACNEAGVIEKAMRSLLALRYPDFEIVAVDDRSTDATGEILDRLAASCPRLRVIHVRDIPPGWLGKNHALQVASDAAYGDWLLFTDADVVFAPDALERAVGYAHRQGIDHLVVSPEMETRGFWEKLFVSYFGLMFSLRVRPWEVADMRKRAYIGLGAFNLVRASAYRRMGGHAALRMEVCDDTKLGKLLKASGARPEILSGAGLMSVRWVVGLRGAIDGLNKNSFAGFEYNLAFMAGSVLLLLLTGLYPLAALATPVAGIRVLGAASLLGMLAGAGAMRRVTGAGALYGLAYPLGTLLLSYIILRSTWQAYRREGILWRGTLYSLEELRRGVV